MNRDQIYIVVPAFNEEKVIDDVIDEIRKAGYEKIIVIDDGSKDNTFNKAKEAGVIALRHKLNRGKGAAAKTGIEAARRLAADIVVTMDADGQHNPADIKLLIKKINEGFDVALGSRMLSRKGMPLIKIAYNYLGNFFTWILYGLWVNDSQSGFRAYSKKAVNLIETRSDRYEYDSEIIREIYRHKLVHAEIPVEVRYTQYSMGKLEKQNLLNGIKTVYRMIWNLLS